MTLQSALFTRRVEAAAQGCAVCRSDPRTVICSCGWSRDLPTPEISDRDLKYPIGFVLRALPGLPDRERTMFDDWFDLFRDAGVEFDTARRAAFARTLRSPRP